MGIFKIRKGEHVVRETEFVRYLRRHLRDETLFTGFNVLTGRWFLGLWLRKDQGLAQDIEDLGANMEGATRQLVKDLERSRDGITAEDVKKRLLKHEQRGIDQEREEAEEFQEVQNWTMKKYGSDVPVLLG